MNDWEEYLALGEEYLPTFFQQSAISHKKGQTEIRLKDFQVDFKHPAITGDSGLRLHLGYANDQLLAEDLVMLSFSPEKGSSSSYSIQPYYETSPFSSDISTETWKESISGTVIFPGKKLLKAIELLFGRRPCRQQRR
ncbi:hypothetical protein H206_00188 [Candidatus Electrothrix aarhusensis]|uniref:Uncharacterized protein n=1 Tax=Candidatus Electrothrix aarhusensis TaxID=1859131 RepID=A0A3S3UA25_9BACT|nr:hypothetical protein H206_00188 [Candidatus Electrothrix aarhusensis]